MERISSHEAKYFFRTTVSTPTGLM